MMMNACLVRKHSCAPAQRRRTTMVLDGQRTMGDERDWVLVGFFVTCSSSAEKRFIRPAKQDEMGLCAHSTICQPDDSHAFGRTFGGRPAREATDRRAQREPPWRQKFKLPPLRAERRRHLALVWENCGTRPTRCSRHPGDVPVGLDPQFSMSKKTTAAIPRSMIFPIFNPPCSCFS